VRHHHDFFVRIAAQEPRWKEDRNKLRFAVARGDIDANTVFVALFNRHEHVRKHPVVLTNYKIGHH
jgi:hypothetical protein